MGKGKCLMHAWQALLGILMMEQAFSTFLGLNEKKEKKTIEL